MSGNSYRAGSTPGSTRGSESGLYRSIWRAARSLRPKRLRSLLHQPSCKIDAVVAYVHHYLSIVQALFSAFCDDAARNADDEIQATGWTKASITSAFAMNCCSEAEANIVPEIKLASEITTMKSVKGGPAGPVRDGRTGRVFVTRAAAEKRFKACIEAILEVCLSANRTSRAKSSQLFKDALDCNADGTLLAALEPCFPPHPVVVALGLNLPHAGTFVNVVAECTSSSFDLVEPPDSSQLAARGLVDRSMHRKVAAGSGYGLEFLRYESESLGVNPLEILAAGSGCLDGLRALYDHDAGPREWGWTALHQAGVSGQVKVVEYLMEEHWMDSMVCTGHKEHQSALHAAMAKNGMASAADCMLRARGGEALHHIATTGRQGWLLSQMMGCVPSDENTGNIVSKLLRESDPQWDIPFGEAGEYWCTNCGVLHDDPDAVSHPAGRSVGEGLLIAASQTDDFDAEIELMLTKPGISQHLHDALGALGASRPAKTKLMGGYHTLPAAVLIFLLRHDYIPLEKAAVAATQQYYDSLLRELGRLDYQCSEAQLTHWLSAEISHFQALMRAGSLEKEGVSLSKRVPSTPLSRSVQLIPSLRKLLCLPRLPAGVPPRSVSDEDSVRLNAVALVQSFIVTCPMDRTSYVRTISIVDNLARLGMPVGGQAAPAKLVHPLAHTSLMSLFIQDNRCAEPILGRPCMTPLAFAAATGKLYLAAYLLLRGARLHPTYDDVTKEELDRLLSKVAGPVKRPKERVLHAVSSCSTSKLKRLLLDRSTDKHLEWAKYGMGCNFKRQLALVRFRDAVRVRAQGQDAWVCALQGDEAGFEAAVRPGSDSKKYSKSGKGHVALAGYRALHVQGGVGGLGFSTGSGPSSGAGSSGGCQWGGLHRASDCTLLMAAAVGGSPAIVRSLLQLGQDPLHRCSDGCTALYWAVRFGGRSESAQEVLSVLVRAEQTAHARARHRAAARAHAASLRQEQAQLADYVRKLQQRLRMKEEQEQMAMEDAASIDIMYARNVVPIDKNECGTHY